MTQLQEAIRDKITKYSDACGMCTDTTKDCDTCSITCMLEDLNELQRLANSQESTSASQPKEPVRLIDASNVMEAVFGVVVELYDSEYFAIQHAIEKLSTIDPESLRHTAHWTSVKDRLPDPYEKVLVRLDHWAGVDTYLAFYDPKRGWCDCGGYFEDGTNNDGEPLTYETVGVNVTHWMSLPKLPEDEGYYV